MHIEYDYIIGGGGVSGISLALSMVENKYFDNKKILILEPDAKTENDRTLCSWVDAKSVSPLAKKVWSSLIFNDTEGKSTDLNLQKYAYQMVSGIDLYKHFREVIGQRQNIDLVQDQIVKINENSDGVDVSTATQSYKAAYLFKSYTDVTNYGKHHNVLQHFKGWIINTTEAAFSEKSAHFMDFRTSQQEGTCFFYVLPTSETEALIELAVFSNRVWEDEEYDDAIMEYIQDKLKIQHYDILDEEVGVIPMTTYPFADHDTAKVIHIGTAGGVVKPSTGYSYSRALKHADAIAEHLAKGKHPSGAQSIFKSRYKWFDKIFLNVILTGKMSGSNVFTQLLTKIAPDDLFAFLDENQSLIADIKILSVPPKLPFLKAAFKEI